MPTSSVVGGYVANSTNSTSPGDHKFMYASYARDERHSTGATGEHFSFTTPNYK